MLVTAYMKTMYAMKAFFIGSYGFLSYIVLEQKCFFFVCVCPQLNISLIYCC